MTEFPYKIGYGRPPAHSRFQKGQTGNPGGKKRSKSFLQLNFEVALTEALKLDEKVLRNFRPRNAVETLAIQIVLNAIDGRPSAQRLVLALLECGMDEGREVGVMPPETDAVAALFDNDGGLELLDERHGEFDSRFKKAVAAGSGDQLLELVEDFDKAGEFPD